MKINFTALKEFMVKRLKNKAFWVATLSGIIMLGEQSGAYKIPADANFYVNAFLSILVFLGILVDTSTPGIGDAKTIIQEVEQIVEKVDPKDANVIETVVNVVEPIIEPMLEAQVQK
jgi:uncharacterized membrane protein